MAATQTGPVDINFFYALKDQVSALANQYKTDNIVCDVSLHEDTQLPKIVLTASYVEQDSEDSVDRTKQHALDLVLPRLKATGKIRFTELRTILGNERICVNYDRYFEEVGARRKKINGVPYLVLDTK
jgi:hypothetical protein